MLAKHGVNLVRIHHGYFDEKGDVDLAAVQARPRRRRGDEGRGDLQSLLDLLPALAQAEARHALAQGLRRQEDPFAALFFNKEFQEHYQEWWKALLLTPNPSTGKRLIDDPAVAGLEIINEDSYFFWTFNADSDPRPRAAHPRGPVRRLAEAEVRLARRGHSGRGAGRRSTATDPAEGRVGFRPLWNMFNEKTARDKDAARFLVESQRGFYRDTYRVPARARLQGRDHRVELDHRQPARSSGRWRSTPTPSPTSSTATATSAATAEGEASEWSIRDGHTYADRSALRFDPEEPGKPKVFVHPAMDPSYDGKPSMISETTWNRPNRYRSEAPLFYAAYGALQDSDAIVHFALDTAAWSVKPGFFMQPWTLMSPAMMGQFPAAALIYRKGLVATGDLLVDLNLKLDDLFDLKGTPLPQDAALDELRLKDVPKGTTLKPGNVIDPLVHFAGRTNVNFTDRGGPPRLKDLKPFIDRRRQVVASSTGELRLDYGKGVLTINAPAAQGIERRPPRGGHGRAQGSDHRRRNWSSGHIVAVSLDGKPLATSRQILLQAMSEEKPTGFRTEPAPGGEKKITSIGHDPWLVEGARRRGEVQAARRLQLKVTALDFNGDPGKSIGTASEIRLAPSTIYYLITP